MRKRICVWIDGIGLDVNEKNRRERLFDENKDEKRMEVMKGKRKKEEEEEEEKVGKQRTLNKKSQKKSRKR